MPVTINTDGACIGNPGAGGFAAIIQWGEDGELTVSGGDPQTTNNRMELAAVIEGIRILDDLPVSREDRITVRTDSQYITRAFNDRWLDGWQRNGWQTAKGGPVQNRELWEEMLKLTEGRSINWFWIRGHSGDPMNEKCDSIAMKQAEAAQGQTGYWVSAGNPMSGETQPHGRETADGEPGETAEPDPGQEALRLIQGLNVIIRESGSFQQFRSRAIALLDETAP